MTKKETLDGFPEYLSLRESYKPCPDCGSKVKGHPQYYRDLEIITDYSTSYRRLLQPVRAYCDVCGWSTNFHDTTNDCMNDWNGQEWDTTTS